MHTQKQHSGSRQCVCEGLSCHRCSEKPAQDPVGTEGMKDLSSDASQGPVNPVPGVFHNLSSHLPLSHEKMGHRRQRREALGVGVACGQVAGGVQDWCHPVHLCPPDPVPRRLPTISTQSTCPQLKTGWLSSHPVPSLSSLTCHTDVKIVAKLVPDVLHQVCGIAEASFLCFPVVTYRVCRVAGGHGHWVSPDLQSLLVPSTYPYTWLRAPQRQRLPIT